MIVMALMARTLILLQPNIKMQRTKAYVITCLMYLPLAADLGRWVEWKRTVLLHETKVLRQPVPIDRP